MLSNKKKIKDSPETHGGPRLLVKDFTPNHQKINEAPETKVSPRSRPIKEKKRITDPWYLQWAV
jgi:hypothetical protein